MIIVNFPSEMMQIDASYDVNDDSLGLTHILTQGEIWMEMEKVTTKELQSTIKFTLKEIFHQEFNSRLFDKYILHILL